MRRNEIIILCVATALLVLVFVILGLFGALELSNKIDTSQLIQIIITFVLVLVTLAYVKRTAEIAGATREQADAVIEQAKVTKEQTKILKETVGLSIRPFFDMTITAVKGGVTYEFEPPDEFTIRIENVGKGPARGLFISCSGDGILYSEESLRNLNQGEHKEFSIQRQTSLAQRPKPKVKQLSLTIIYLDELGYTLESSMPINCDGKNWEPGAITMIIEDELP